jgi:predicted nucleotide-binding protein (sugar kinase/HSP70/actin superfamily)
MCEALSFRSFCYPVQKRHAHQGKTSLFEKEGPKNFFSPAMATQHPGHGRREKVFCFFSSEKKALPCY